MQTQRLMIIALLIALRAAGDTYLAGGPYTPDKYTVLLLHFNEAAGVRPQDSSPYANHPTTGALTTGAAGVFGGAMVFTNGTSIGVPYKSSFMQVYTNGFIEFWMKPSTNTIDRWGSDQSIFSHNRSGPNQGDFTLGMRMNPIVNGGGVFQFLLETGTGTYRTLRTPGLIKTVKWYHVVASWDCANKPVIVVDGVKQTLGDFGTNASNTGPISTVMGLMIGNNNGLAGSFIFLDEVRIGTPPPPAGTRIEVR